MNWQLHRAGRTFGKSVIGAPASLRSLGAPNDPSQQDRIVAESLAIQQALSRRKEWRPSVHRLLSEKPG